MRIEEFLKKHKGRHFYHFTDERNLPSIKKHGLYALSEHASLSIAPKCHGGDAQSHADDRLKGVDKFVHLCPIASHPMEFRAKESGRLKSTRFLEISSEILRVPGTMGCPTLTTKANAKILPIEKALDEIEFHILYAGYVDFSENPEFMKRHDLARRAEILIPKHVPVKYIRNL